MLADEEGMRQAHEWLERDRDRWRSLAYQLWSLLRSSTSLSDDDIRVRVRIDPPVECETEEQQ